MVDDEIRLIYDIALMPILPHKYYRLLILKGLTVWLQYILKPSENSYFGRSSLLNNAPDQMCRQPRCLSLYTIPRCEAETNLYALPVKYVSLKILIIHSVA